MVTLRLQVSSKQNNIVQSNRDIGWIEQKTMKWYKQLKSFFIIFYSLFANKYQAAKKTPSSKCC